MQRKTMTFLIDWLASADRLPLVIRGARQVGKTWLVQNLANTQNKDLIEINLELDKGELYSLFASDDPKKILRNLNEAFNKEFIPEKSILFIDEIQEKPELLAKLRWFAEKMPSLPVIAAGSLLEFTLGKHAMSMPVGRIEFMYLEPLSFEEFLLAKEKTQLIDLLQRFTWQDQIPSFTHNELMRQFKEYIIVGGMPAAVKSWVQYESFEKISKVHQNLLATYRADFGKYSGRISPSLLNDTLRTIPAELGQKFVYSKVNTHVQVPAIKQALNLLAQARVCHKVVSTSANGIPLEAESNEKYIKVILLDVGLCSAALGISLNQIESVDEIDLVNKGGIAEQVVGQLLRTIYPFYVDPALHYWIRSEKGSSAEVDYVMQHHNKVMPIEVKAGSTGAMKSLQLYMSEKGLGKAVRFYSNIPLMTKVSVKDRQGKLIEYKLHSIPFYLIGQMQRLIS